MNYYDKDNKPRPDYISKELKAAVQKAKESEDELIIAMGEKPSKVRESRKLYGISWHKWYEIDKKKKPSKRFLQKTTDAWNFYCTTYGYQKKEISVKDMVLT